MTDGITVCADRVYVDLSNNSFAYSIFVIASGRIPSAKIRTTFIAITFTSMYYIYVMARSYVILFAVIPHVLWVVNEAWHVF